MRTGIKVAAWAAVFLACAGVGAYLAAHSDPFPPGVDRPGASSLPTVTPSSTATPEVVLWVGRLTSVSTHELYVGGGCTSRWNGNLRFTVDAEGQIGGSGAARLSGDLRCDFPIAQTQLRRIGLTVKGRILEGGMSLRLGQSSIDPTNGRDFGAFSAFLPFHTLLATQDGTVDMTIDRRRTDEHGRGTYTIATTFRLHLASG